MSEAITVKIVGGDWTLEIDADFTAGDPGCYTLPNGDPGYPPTGDELDVTGVTLHRPDAPSVDLGEILGELGLLECDRFVSMVSDAVYAKLEERQAEAEDDRLDDIEAARREAREFPL